MCLLENLLREKFPSFFWSEQGFFLFKKLFYLLDILCPSRFSNAAKRNICIAYTELLIGNIFQKNIHFFCSKQEGFSMKAFQTYVAEWERNAEKDAYWAVLTSYQQEQTGWSREAFFNSGKQEIESLMEYAKKSSLPIDFSGNALDFGCGTGRLSQALGTVFNTVCGIDVSAIMIQKAKEALIPSMHNIEFIHNPVTNLKVFEHARFDFIYSNIVLQHIAPRHQMRYLEEFARVLNKQGWMIVQIPSKRIYNSWAGKIKGSLVNLLPYKIKKQLLIHVFKNRSRALKEFDFEMNVRSEKSIQRYADKHGLKIRHIVYTNSCDPDFSGNLSFKTYEEVKDIPGYLSPMYFLQKTRAMKGVAIPI
jgi:ubiquinone/menaquinone biosynthesis C-methylase UbiE